VFVGADGRKLGAIHKVLVRVVSIASGRRAVKSVLEGIVGEELSGWYQRGLDQILRSSYLKYAIELI